MKIYISADMEGLTGIAAWDETSKSKPDYPPFRDEMMKEVIAACEGANLSGAKEILINDAHDAGRNLCFAGLPENVKMIRSSSKHPYCMMQGLDKTFDAALMIGYHSHAGSDRNPLAHTINSDIAYIKINDIYTSEFLMNAYTAAMLGVPVVFVSGDRGLCESVKEINGNIRVVATNEGYGGAVLSEHPNVIASKIRSEVHEALKQNLETCRINLPDRFRVEISFVNHIKAYKGSFYPGIKKVSPLTLVYETDDYFEVLRMFLFVL